MTADGQPTDRSTSGAKCSSTDGTARSGQTGEPAVRVSNLALSFGEVSVLEDVSFDLPGGTVSALVGANGSGKTTLLRLVAGTLAADAGDVRRPTGPRAVGYLPQDPSFRASFTVAETLGFYARLLEADDDVDATLERVGLTEVADRRVDALSGGMVRLLGLAQAMLGNPELVVLDEPTGDLDPQMTEYIFRTVGDLSDEGTTVLLATHDLTGAAVADQVLVLHRGSIVERGAPGTIADSAAVESLTDAVLDILESDGDRTVRSSPVVTDGTGDGGESG